MNARTWFLVIGVAVGLVIMAVGLYESSERNRDVVAYARNECAFLEDVTPVPEARFDPYAGCMSESVNQHVLKPGSTWYLLGGFIAVGTVTLYWRMRPRSAPQI